MLFGGRPKALLLVAVPCIAAGDVVAVVVLLNPDARRIGVRASAPAVAVPGGFVAQYLVSVRRLRGALELETARLQVYSHGPYSHGLYSYGLGDWSGLSGLSGLLGLSGWSGGPIRPIGPIELIGPIRPHCPAGHLQVYHTLSRMMDDF